jgi:hypothetical protein
VGFDAANSSVSESIGTAQIGLRLSAASDVAVTVNYGVGGTATPGVDYAVLPGAVTFNPYETTKTISVTIINDTRDEPDETVILTLTTATGAEIEGITSHTLTIVDNDPPPTVQFSAASSSAGEGIGTANVLVTLSAASGRTVTANYSVGGTATPGVDYAALSGSVTFAPGTTARNITVAITSDLFYESNETVILTLTDATNATLGATRVHTFTIIDDDLRPRVGFDRTTQSVDEDRTSVSATVRLTPASGKIASVRYTTANGTATAGSDYTSASGTVTFNPGQTAKAIYVLLRNDTISEGNETFSIRLSAAVNATLTTATQVITIVDNDRKTPTARWRMYR